MIEKLWSVKANRVSALLKISSNLGFKEYEDWYNLTRKDIIDQGFHTMIKYYNESPSKLVIDNFPEYDWKPWLFKNLPRNFWLDDKNLISFFLWLQSKLKITDLSDWYLVNTQILQNYRCYKCLYDSLKKVYPNYDWKPWLFTNPPKKIWQDREVRSKFFFWVQKELGIKNTEDWYNVTIKVLNAFNIGGMLSRHYKSSVFHFVKEHSPEYDWKPWLFAKVSSFYWKDVCNRRKFGEWLIEKLEIDSPEKWYLVSQKDIVMHGGAALLSKYYGGSPANFVMSLFPEFNLDIDKFKNRKGQSKLFSLVKDVFPANKVLWEYKHDKIRSRYNRRLELDIFIPDINLAFEFQGEQHYGKGRGYFKKNWDRVRENDFIKKAECQKLGIKLIEIPYHWDQTKKYLIDKLKEMDVFYEDSHN